MVTQRSRRVRPQWRTRFPESESGGEDVQSVVDDTGDLGPDLLAFFEGQPNVKPYLDDRLTELEAKIQSAIDIGLENRTLLEQLREQVKQGQQNGLGAIHSLDDGRVQLEFPLFYSLQVLGEEVLVGIDELSAYGVGESECDAVAELQEELWGMFQELEEAPAEELGPQLTQKHRTLKARILRNAVDA